MPRLRQDKRRRLLLRWGGLSIGVTAVIVFIVAMLARSPTQSVPAAGANIDGLTSVLRQSATDSEVPLRFVDVTSEMGITFRHMPIARKSLLPEDIGSGVAAGDFDNDGYTDLFFVNFSGNATPGAALDRKTGTAQLYRNDHGKHFENVTASAGVGFIGYGLGAAWGDYDSDGDLDLYVTAFGPNILYENQGDGTFRDATEKAMIQDTRFSAGASWSDFDRDGDLDLYVCNYVAFEYREDDQHSTVAQYATEQPYTLNPSSYPAQSNALFRNNGDGTFDDVAMDAGVADPRGKSLSASWTDLNNDGWVDLYVANDVSNNAVFLNRCADGALLFEDVGAATLAADYRGAMGIAVADFDNDLDQDLLITHWIAQENALYRNMLIDNDMSEIKNTNLWFMDDADRLGLGQVSLDLVGWAAGFCDFDNDGRLDLWVVNGSTMEQSSDRLRLQGQPSSLYWNRGQRGYVDVTEFAAPPMHEPAVRRGGAQLDIDLDGLVDLVICKHSGRPTILRNTSTPSGNWLRIRLEQHGGNTAALGARVNLTTGSVTQMAELGASSSYLSQDEQIIHFGVGNASTAGDLRIYWPDGHIDSHTIDTVNQTLCIEHAAIYD